LEPRRITVKTGLGDAYVAGKSLGFLQDRGRLAGLVLGNTNAMVKLERGDFPTMREVMRRSKTMRIKEAGREQVESLMRALKADTVEIKI
jgi:hypothetical protein